MLDIFALYDQQQRTDLYEICTGTSLYKQQLLDEISSVFPKLKLCSTQSRKKFAKTNQSRCVQVFQKQADTWFRFEHNQRETQTRKTNVNISRKLNATQT